VNVAFYLSNHGFGHATRAVALAQELTQAGVFCLLVTDRPDYLFADLDQRYWRKRTPIADVGLVQTHWRRADAPDTLAALQCLIAESGDVIQREAEWLRRKRIDLVVADVPPLAFPAAELAGVPSVAVSNFDWPHLYEPLLKGLPGATETIAAVRAACARATLALRLPFSNALSMSSFPRVEPAGLLARTADRRRASVRRELGLATDDLLVVTLFGGFGANPLDLDALCAVPHVRVMAVEGNCASPRFTRIPPQVSLTALLPAADAVVTKLGYSTLAECVAAGVPVLCVRRENNIEDEVLLHGLQAFHHPHVVLPLERIGAVDWPAELAGLRSLPPAHAPRPVNRAIAQRCVALAWPQRAGRAVVIDLGTNNILLLWASVEGGTITPLHRAGEVSALGRGMKNGLLTQAGLRRARAILNRYLSLSRGFSERIYVYGTSCSREATNISLLADWLRRRHGVRLHILSGEEEARYGALAAVTSFGRGRLFTFDIGGGSTECALLDGGEVLRWTSLPVGLRRLEGLFGTNSEARQRYMREQLQSLADWDLQGALPVGLGGTVCNLAAVKLGQRRYDGDAVHGTPLSLEDLCDYESRMATMTDAELAELMPFEPSRAKLVLAGVEWMRLLLRRSGASALLACDRGTQFGYLQSVKP